MSDPTEKTFSPCSASRLQSLQQAQDESSIMQSVADKRTTREGNAPKRRGPKPDSKPALTRRQELNRQAQRTHRERKELYVKALEDEVIRLKDVFTHTTQAKDKLAEENRHLREVLNRNGIQLPGSALPDDMVSNRSAGGSVSDHSHATTSRSAVTSGMTGQSSAPSLSPSAHATSYPSMSGPERRDKTHQATGGSRVDYEQEGIDFVLTLEKPCMEHLPILVDRSSAPGGGPCGHALMATCPPQPFGELRSQETPGSFQVPNSSNSYLPTWELNKSSLSILLDLSKRLDLDGEITPVMAWGMIMGHPNSRDLQPAAFQKLAEELGRKVRCYGFGAVIEDFEVRDAIESVISIH